MGKVLRHYEKSTNIVASPEEVFAYADNPANFSSHMNKSSWMMGGSRMNTHVDEKKFQGMGSQMQMDGTVFGIKLFLDEVITKYEPPFLKEWKTIGNINLVVIGHYSLGFEVKSESENSILKVYINYELPNSFVTRSLGYLFGGMYAKWCVKQMLNGTADHFRSAVN